jgi:F-type H+-transporting ATPase subunit alpha
VTDEVALMLAVQAGILDRLGLEVVAEFRKSLPGTLDRDASEALSDFAKTGEINAKAHEKLMRVLTRLAATLAGDETEANVPSTGPPTP